MIPFVLSIAMAALACAAVVARPKSVLIRAFLILGIISGSATSMWLSSEYAGKPLEMDVPADIIVYGQAVDVRGGKIYIMFKHTDGKLPTTHMVTDYNKKLSEALKEGKKKGSGKPFRMKNATADGKGNEGQAGGREGGSEGDGTGSGSMSEESNPYSIHSLPPAILPQKDQ